jgi:pimeloyl-ACP methyl ester carboxylesterase
MADTNPTIVLVHGALTDASVWHGVITELQKHGHQVAAPAIPMRGLSSDIQYLRSYLETIEGPIVVVGHSYGGSIISAPEALTPSVTALGFVAAFIQDSDETAGELNYRFPGSRLVPETTIVRDYPGGSDMYLRFEFFAEVYAADIEPAQAAVMAAAQHPIDPSALGETFKGTATWRTLPSRTLVATADVSVPTEAQYFMAERAGSTVVEVNSSHAVPASRVKETTDFITGLVSATE